MFISSLSFSFLVFYSITVQFKCIGRHNVFYVPHDIILNITSQCTIPSIPYKEQHAACPWWAYLYSWRNISLALLTLCYFRCMAHVTVQGPSSAAAACWPPNSEPVQPIAANLSTCLLLGDTPSLPLSVTMPMFQCWEGSSVGALRIAGCASTPMIKRKPPCCINCAALLLNLRYHLRGLKITTYCVALGLSPASAVAGCIMAKAVSHSPCAASPLPRFAFTRPAAVCSPPTDGWKHANSFSPQLQIFLLFRTLPAS